MFRFAVAAGCAQLVAGARTQEMDGQLSLDDIQNNQHDTLSASENSNSTTYCPYASGFTAHEGKCTGQFVETWADGEYAYYGQDSNGHIHGLADTAYRCSQHWDCSGFYTREGVGYSHWRTGRFAVNPNPGHCCYRKVGGGSNLLEVNEFENADAEGAMVATQGEAQPQRCDAGRTCPTYDHCHPVSYGAYGCGFQCTRQGGHGSYLCNNHCVGCNYVSLLELSPSLMQLSANENADGKFPDLRRGGSCPEVSGFAVTPGKCEGTEGPFFSLQDQAEPSARVCAEHSDCSGFWFGPYSDAHWSTGHIWISPRAGHCCYQKLNNHGHHGGRSRPTPAPAPPHASHLNSNRHGCYTIDSESQCTSSMDGRRDYVYQPCAWCCGSACTRSERYRCQPENWLIAQPNRVGGYKTGTGRNGCYR